MVLALAYVEVKISSNNISNISSGIGRSMLKKTTKIIFLKHLEKC